MTIDPAVIADFGKSIGVNAFMNTRWGWPTIESIHFTCLTLLLGTVGLFDLRILGIGRGVSMAVLHRLVPIGVVAYLGSILTGSMFILTMANQYVFNPAFQLKLLFMAIAGVNTAVFYLVAARAVNAAGPDEEAPLAAKIIAVISLLSWTAVIILGRVITLFRPPFHWCPWC